MKFDLIETNLFAKIIIPIIWISLGLLLYQSFFNLEIRELNIDSMHMGQITFSVFIVSLILGRLLKRKKKVGTVLINHDNITLKRRSESQIVNAENCEWDIYSYDGQPTSAIRQLSFDWWRIGTGNFIILNSDNRKYEFYISNEKDFKKIKNYAQQSLK